MKLVITKSLPFPFENSLGKGYIYISPIRANVPNGGFTIYIGTAFLAVYIEGAFQGEPPLLLSKLGTEEEMAEMLKSGIEVPDDLIETNNQVAVLIESLKTTPDVKIVT